MGETEFDCVVVGGAPGGYVAAIRARQLGMTAAAVEREELLFDRAILAVGIRGTSKLSVWKEPATGWSTVTSSWATASRPARQN